MFLIVWGKVEVQYNLGIPLGWNDSKLLKECELGAAMIFLVAPRGTSATIFRQQTFTASSHNHPLKYYTIEPSSASISCQSLMKSIY